MPEANVLYTVTAVVVAALVLWVAAVLSFAKAPWARPAPAGAGEIAESTSAEGAEPGPASASKDEGDPAESEEKAEKADEKSAEG